MAETNHKISNPCKSVLKWGKFTKLTFYFNPQSMQVSREAWERQITNQQDMKVRLKA